jgi:hypothetical protein
VLSCCNRLGFWYADRRYAQEVQSCLTKALDHGHLDVVKCLVEVGGKELLTLVDKVCARACKCLCLFILL